MNELPVANKTLGQHWLSDQATLESVVSFADIKKGDVVLEIGPGTGTLTDALLAAGAEVIALEYDHNRVDELRKKYQNHGSTEVFIQEGDIRTYDFGNLNNFKIVANIPYYLTANLLRKLTDEEPKPSSATLLVQKEVAERLAASPGKLSMVAVFVQFYYQVELGPVVKAELFTPPPKVDSQVVKLARRPQPLFEVPAENFFRLVKAGFSQPRKKLRSSLNHGLGLPKAEVEMKLSRAGIDPSRRAQELSVDDWYQLYQILNT